MSCLYKRTNRLWPFLIRHRLTAAAWRPLVEGARRRHLRFRRRLAAGGAASECDPQVRVIPPDSQLPDREVHLVEHQLRTVADHCGVRLP